ncbi:hypothetical protein FB451DRAFT_1019734 [Mycena latifolia]|nr:hypothetical protein FB451DRAFT_1062359 [Mycena latifolia]KAJ7494955.1 hypothetical protein FB451DRAFT_1019734 [Mycena latifolia]
MDDDDAPESPTPQGENPSPPRRRRIPAPPADPFATPVRHAITSLQATSSAFLVSSSPIHASSTPPRFPAAEISPEKARDVFLLSAEPTTALERELQTALRRELERNKTQKQRLVAMQSALVLNGAYVDLVRGQLAAQEKKKSDKKKGRLVGDGLPRLLTSREFVRRVTEFEKNARKKEEGLKQRKADREEKSAAMKEWKELDEARKARNKEIRSDYDARVKAWEAERDIAKEERRRPRWKKPTLKGLLFSPLPKPSFAVEPGEKAVERDSDVEESNDGPSGNGGDDGSENSDDDPPSTSEDESASELGSDGSGE